MDPKDTIAEAYVKVRGHAASLLFRKEALERELEAAKKERERVEGELEGVRSAGREDLVAQFSAVLSEMAEKETSLREQHALAAQAFQETLGNLREVEKLARDAERGTLRATVDAATTPSPFPETPEDLALENVRAHLAELEARVELDKELGGNRVDRDKLEREAAEVQARAELAELKKKKAGGGGSGAGSGGGGGEGAPPSPGGRTL